MLNSKIILNSEQDSINLAIKLAQTLAKGDIVAFSGDLGSGKTFFCRQIIQFFCGSSTNVISPTFNLLQTYKTKDFTIFHFDLYRLKISEEIYELGIEEALQNNLCLIEWPELVEHLLPRPVIRVNLLIENNQRMCELCLIN